jgi:hypothetical protein
MRNLQDIIFHGLPQGGSLFIFSDIQRPDKPG